MGSSRGRERSGRRGAAIARCALALAALSPIAAPAPATATELSSGQASLFSSASIYPPSASEMTVCYGFGCRRRAMLDFTAADRGALARILAGGRGSAAAERAAVRKAMVWFDRRMGPVIGTTRRVARADITAPDVTHNYDCWDTTRNTTGLLLVLQGWGLLRYHVVGDPQSRGLIIQRPHNTAVLVERATKAEWAVDMWTHAYAEPPDVMPLAQWVKEF